MNKPPLKTYLKLCTEFYDLELKNDQKAAIALSFFMDYAIKANGKILEPMCGSGRFLIPMLQAGLDIEGFDASSHMLDALKQKHASISTSKPPIWQQFIEDFTNDKLYNLIFIPFGSWGLITDLENSKKSLEIMHSHLAPGGKFIIEIDTIASAPEQCGIPMHGSHIRDNESRIVLNTIPSYNKRTQMFTATCRYELFIKNILKTTENENFEQYLYRFDEMDKLLKDAGFTEIKKYADYSKAPATNTKTPIVIYECTK